MKTTVGISLLVAASAAALTLNGCGGKAKEVTQEQIAEAVANQAISAYYTTSTTLSNQNGQSLTFSCTKGGSFTWDSYESNGSLCFDTESKGCVISTAGGSITIDGGYTACGFPPSLSEEGGLEDLDGKTLTIEGDIAASNASGASASCDYNLQLTAIDATDNGDTVTFSSGVTGTLCDSRNVDISVSFTVTDNVEIND